MTAYRESLNLAITGLDRLRAVDRLLKSAADSADRLAGRAKGPAQKPGGCQRGTGEESWSAPQGRQTES